MTPTLQALLDAHVQFELTRLRGASLDELIDSHGEACFAWLTETSLSELVTPEQVMGVIDRYVIELKVGGGITELAGEMSRAILSSEATAETRLEQILEPETFAEFADKVESLGDARRALIEQISKSPNFAELISRVALRIVGDSLFPAGEGRSLGILARLREPLRAQWTKRVGPLLTRFVAERTDRAIEAHRERWIEALASDGMRAVVDDLFDALASHPLSDTTRVFTAQDLEDFVVLGFEFWLTFRKTEFFRRAAAEVVDKLFDKYGRDGVVAVLEDLGIDPALILQEIKAFAGPIFALAERSGFLERRVRSVLEPFYASAEAQRALAGQER
jgi:hypothetical protein